LKLLLAGSNAGVGRDTPFAMVMVRSFYPFGQIQIVPAAGQHIPATGHFPAAAAGASAAGSRSKKPSGTSEMLCHIVGITGQSSGRGT
jgi:hypothetical protein